MNNREYDTLSKKWTDFITDKDGINIDYAKDEVEEFLSTLDRSEIYDIVDTFLNPE